MDKKKPKLKNDNNIFPSEKTKKKKKSYYYVEIVDNFEDVEDLFKSYKTD